MHGTVSARSLTATFGLAIILTVGGGTLAQAAESVELSGRMEGISNFSGPDCGSATGVCSRFTSSGSIIGDGVVFVDTPPSADGISKAHTVITTVDGDLTCSETAVFDLTPESDHAFVDLCIIDGGTGRYAGATGYIQESGTFDFETNVGAASYVGRLILP
jgi:hypothetical protein